MRIAVVGCGAMGSVYAGLLGAAGNDVLAIDRSTAHVDAIRTKGLRVEGASGDQTVNLRAATSVPNEHMDLVIVATKAAQAGSAAREAARLIGDATVVLTIQNGLGASRDVAEAVGSDRLAVGIAGGFGAARRGPGHVYHAAIQTVRMGAFAGLARSDLEVVANTWSGAGFNVDIVDDVAAMQWEKLICNVAFSGPCALTGLAVGEAMDDPDVGPVCLGAAVEAWTVARALGIQLAIDDPVALVSSFAETVRSAKPSVLQDIEAGRVSEIDVINGAIPREARRVNLEAPVNATITALVRQHERRLQGS